MLHWVLTQSLRWWYGQPHQFWADDALFVALCTYEEWRCNQPRGMLGLWNGKLLPSSCFCYGVFPLWPLWNGFHIDLDIALFWVVVRLYELFQKEILAEQLHTQNSKKRTKIITMSPLKRLKPLAHQSFRKSRHIDVVVIFYLWSLFRFALQRR